MAALHVSIDIDRSPAEVWAYLRNIGSHVEWMADAEEIRFTTDQTEGEGTSFECETKVGPIRLTDVMTVTRWEEGAVMGVRHNGLVTGSGEFRLTPLEPGRTRFSWREDLSFPWWLGGPIGELVATPVLRAVWRGNLDRLARRLG